MIRAFANYQRFSEFTTTAYGYDESPNGFDGNGISYKAKLIGMEDVESDRDEQLSLDSLVRLKAMVRARGEHKQKIQLNLAISGVQVIDELTKAQLVCHEIRRISFVIMDPSDPRAFGYIYNTTDGRHQFWAIKSDGLAQSVVFALRDLFEEVYKQMNNSDETATPEDQIVSTPVSLNEKIGLTQKSSSNLTAQTTQSTKTFLFDDTWGGNFVPAAAPKSFTTFEQQSTSNTDPWGFSEPVKQPDPPVDSPVNMFDFPPPALSTTSTTTQPPAPTADTGDLFSLFSTNYSAFPVTDNGFIQPIQPAIIVSPQEQTNYLNSKPVSSISSPPTTNPSNEYDLLGDFS